MGRLCDDLPAIVGRLRSDVAVIAQRFNGDFAATCAATAQRCRSDYAAI